MKNLFSTTGLLAAFAAAPALAQENLEIIGAPIDGKMGFQPAATELARDIHALDNLLLIVITIITVFVTALMLWCIYRFSKKRNPEAASFTHHTTVEVLWTVVPIVVLVFIGAYSLPILFKQQEIPTADVTIKAIGNQWYWTHEYVEHDFGFDSYLIGSDATLDTSVRSEDENVTAFVLDEHMEAKLADAGYSRNEWLLATDTAVVVPVNKTIVVQVTGADVIHAWTIPAFGVKQDAVPGRLAQLWFKAEKEGIYFGQCSELCGKSHAYMPITVKVVSQEAYEAWLQGAIDEYAGTPLPVNVASN
ncbi:MAG: cytochrome c oxidase subunit II [Ascidiaceihabitans sp.]|jgi:cytochrome c oxidase subunit 2|tara:strand:- start:1257 stop:2171 length:915 start_codon:yes stop_codon:yes gene_type:complete